MILQFKWSTSKGRDTYGYNICSLWVDGEKVASTNGGGYDMKGTVLGDFIQENYQIELGKLKPHTIYNWTKKGNKWTYDGIAHDKEGLYGLGRENEGGKVKYTLDGGCGWDSMVKIAEAIGLTLEYAGDAHNLTTYILHDRGVV